MKTEGAEVYLHRRSSLFMKYAILSLYCSNGSQIERLLKVIIHPPHTFMFPPHPPPPTAPKPSPSNVHCTYITQTSSPHPGPRDPLLSAYHPTKRICLQQQRKQQLQTRCSTASPGDVKQMQSKQEDEGQYFFFKTFSGPHGLKVYE